MPYNPWSKGLTKETDPRLAQIAQMKVKPKPNYDELFELYHEQGLTALKIGQQFDLSKTTIMSLLREHDIHPKRHDLTPDLLQELYIEHKMTSGQIGEAYNCSGAHVRNLLTKHNIPTPRLQNRASVQPSPTELYYLYWEERLNYQEIADYYGVNVGTIPYWFHKLDIPRYPNGYPHLIQRQASDGHIVRSNLELQVDEWLTEHNLHHEYEPALPDSYFMADFKVQNVYIEIWGIEGSQRYDQSKQVKLNYYEQHDLRVISIMPSDFPELDPLQALLENRV